MRISFRSALLLGIAGCALMAWPRAFLLRDQIVSGELVHAVLSTGGADPRTIMVGLSVLPVAPLLFLVVLYVESAGKLSVAVRRIASGFAGVLMLLAIVWSAAVPAPIWARVLNLSVFLAWVLLMALFAVRRMPLSDRITTTAMDVIGLLSAVMAGLITAFAGFRHPITAATQIIGPLLVVAFALATGQAMRRSTPNP